MIASFNELSLRVIRGVQGGRGKSTLLRGADEQKKTDSLQHPLLWLCTRAGVEPENGRVIGSN